MTRQRITNDVTVFPTSLRTDRRRRFESRGNFFADLYDLWSDEWLSGSRIEDRPPGTGVGKSGFSADPDQDPADILKKLRAHLDAQGFIDVQITDLGGDAPAALTRTILSFSSSPRLLKKFMKCLKN